MDHSQFQKSLSAPTPLDLSREERSRRTRQLALQLRSTSCPDERERLVDEMILVNRGVADSIAHRYTGRGVSVDDVRQVAAVGLVKGVQRFDPTRDQDLLTFAVPTIRGEIRRYFRDHAWFVRPPRRVQELQSGITRLRETVAQSDGREPSEQEAVAALGTTAEEYREAVTAFGQFSPSSLDRPLREDGATLADVLPDPDDGFAAVEARLLLEPVIGTLSPRERDLLRWRFVEDLTQVEIGRRLGVTQMQVSRLLSSLMARMRESIAGSSQALAA
ncbi:sigma-70 family RNA polymerase sigma factor [Nocardioides yefusunii]|uniref:Sigma-70 family RNA polymerase sigma factor n=1 Tax=Nocardioides yefusunii TaxID=2500546 RepID=A0ABW1QRX9_9ACTN|nr:sigma-70 family RNA polymerase sigma factor [Nocardioides yefusunii]